MNKIFSFTQSEKGMAMVIVLTASFIVLVTVGVGASLIVKNIDQVSGGGSVSRAVSSMQRAIERIRGMAEVSGSSFAACAQDDCINTADGSCVVCSDALVSLGNGNSHKAEITALTNPAATGGGLGFDPIAGTITFKSTGFYKNISKSKSSTMCLNYCAITGRNCGDDGCSGSCGSCTLPQTCGGNGNAGMCETPTSCIDIAVECGDECSNGDTCGGGVVINQDLNIVAIRGGCEDTGGTNCGGGNPDSVAKQWDTDAPVTTNASSTENGEDNIAILDPANNPRYDAALFCYDMTDQGFSDWYLPANNELKNIQEAYNNTFITDISSGCYWSSSENAESTATSQNITGMVVCMDPDNKNTSNLVRCVRRY